MQLFDLVGEDPAGLVAEGVGVLPGGPGWPAASSSREVSRPDLSMAMTAAHRSFQLPYVAGPAVSEISITSSDTPWILLWRSKLILVNR